MTSLSAIALLVAATSLGQAQPVGETVLLDFTADWCGPCQSVRPLVEHLAASGYPVRQVNVDRNRALAAKYGIQSIPCFVMLVNGVEVDREVGPAGQQRLVQMLSKADRQPAAAKSMPRMQAQSPDPQSSRTFAASQSMPAFDPGVNPTQTTSADSAGQLVSLLTKASVRLRVDDPDGHSFGTGTMIDRRGDEALVLTCGHLFRDSKGNGTIWVEVLDGKGGQPIKGQLINYDLDRDLGLISFRPDREVTVASVAPANHQIAPHQQVINVGCNNGQAPTVLQSNVSRVNRSSSPSNIVVTGAPVEGRSGGGLFDESGRLIGVCFGADPKDNEGYYTHLESIQTELTRLGLEDVIAKDNTPKVPSQMPARFAAGEPPAMPSQMPQNQGSIALASGSVSAPVVLSEAAVRQPANTASAAAASRTALDRLSTEERATLEELQSRVKDAEIICIVRPLNNPDAKSEIIVLNHASPLFVEQLSKAAGNRRTHQLTANAIPAEVYPTTSKRVVSTQARIDAQGWKAKR